jgi:hypothetical protein
VEAAGGGDRRGGGLGAPVADLRGLRGGGTDSGAGRAVLGAGFCGGVRGEVACFQ